VNFFSRTNGVYMEVLFRPYVVLNFEWHEKVHFSSNFSPDKPRLETITIHMNGTLYRLSTVC